MSANKGQMKNIKKYIDKDDQIALNKIIEKYEERITQIISDNKKHISEVEELLLNKTHKVRIGEDIKAVAADRAISKLAPFKGDKSNSMADAVILLSSIEYIKGKNKFYESPGEESFCVFPDSIFVTINKGDFANPNNKKEIHPDLKAILASVEMKFEANIGTVINQVHADLIKLEEIAEIAREMEEEYWENIVRCEVCDPDPEKMHVSNIVEFGEPISIVNEIKEEEDVDQMKLFESRVIKVKKYNERIKHSDINSVQLGECNYCASEYIKCQYCGTLNNYDEHLEGNMLECEGGCGIIYQIDYLYVGSGMHEIEIKIVERSNENEG